jgi:hypothetical protein
MDVKKMEERETTQAVPPEFAYIEVRGKRFKVKSLTIEEEGKVVSLRDDLAQGKWGRLAESPSADDRGWALLFQAAAELSFAIVEAPVDFPGATKLKDGDFLYEIWDAYMEKIVRPFRTRRVAEPEKRAEAPGKEGVSPPVVQEPVQPGA